MLIKYHREVNIFIFNPPKKGGDLHVKGDINKLSLIISFNKFENSKFLKWS